MLRDFFLMTVQRHSFNMCADSVLRIESILFPLQICDRCSSYSCTEDGSLYTDETGLQSPYVFDTLNVSYRFYQMIIYDKFPL